MRTLLKLALIVAIILGSTTGFAKTSEWAISDAGMNYSLSKYGASYQLKGHILTILIDQNEVLNHLDEQVNSNIYASSVTKTYLLNHPLLYLFASALNVSTFIIPRVYRDHPNLSYMNVHVRIKYENILGNDSTNPLLYFNMSRHLSDKINWTRFSSKNADLVYPNFNFSNFSRSEAVREKVY